jgi:hypothetical protein
MQNNNTPEDENVVVSATPLLFRWSRQTAVWLRLSARTVKRVAIIVIAIELGGMWYDVHHIRAEQVKNALYAMPREQQKMFEQMGLAKRMESKTNVDADVEGTVSIDGDVNLSEPVEVEVEQ